MTQPHHQVTKAVIPAAGLGTRFLPATKATPKEMLPVVDKPAIQYVVEEAVGAGLDDVLLVTGRNKRSLEDHFDRAWELETALEIKGDDTRLAQVRESQALGDLHYVRQQDPKGLGHAVLCGANHVGSEPFAVLLGDDLIDYRDTLLSTMLDVRNEYGGSVIALIEVDPADVGMYGCAAVEDVEDVEDVEGVEGVDSAGGGDGDRDRAAVRVTDLVEKPSPDQAPSNLALIGRYVLDPAVFEVLRNTAPGRGGEVQLTDALKTLIGVPAGQGGGVRAVVFRGRRYDTGDRQDYLRTTVRLAAEREDLGPQFRAWLRTYVAELPAETPDETESGA